MGLQRYTTRLFLQQVDQLKHSVCKYPMLFMHAPMFIQDFQLQQMQHKMSRLEGERTGDERAKLTERIKVSFKDKLMSM